MRNCLDLLDNYTREEIKTEYILNCLYAELQVQTKPDIQDALASSILEFLWKIGNCSDANTTEAYWRTLQLYKGLQSQQSGFNDFVQGFMDQDHERVRMVVNSVLFQRILPRAQGSPQSMWAQGGHHVGNPNAESSHSMQQQEMGRPPQHTPKGLWACRIP